MKKCISSVLLLAVTSFAAPQVGDKAVAFDLPELLKQEKNIQMKDYDNKLVLFNVWASWCKGCKKEMPFFHKLGKKYAQNDFEVVAVNIDKKSKKAKGFLNKLNEKLDEKAQITFVYDKKKSMPQAYEAKAVPFSLLIKNGTIIKTYLGSFDEDNEHELIADIEAALK